MNSAPPIIQWFSTRDNFVTLETLGNVQGHFCLLPFGWYWHLVVEARDAAKPTRPPRTVPQQSLDSAKAD